MAYQTLIATRPIWSGGKIVIEKGQTIPCNMVDTRCGKVAMMHSSANIKLLNIQLKNVGCPPSVLNQPYSYFRVAGPL